MEERASRCIVHTIQPGLPDQRDLFSNPLPALKPCNKPFSPIVTPLRPHCFQLPGEGECASDHVYDFNEEGVEDRYYADDRQYT